MEKIKNKYKQFEEWFDLHCGWFLTNGRKVEMRELRLREKFNIRRKYTTDIPKSN
jgi:hypothetical protein